MNPQPNLVALGLIVSDKKIFKDFATWLPWQPELCLDSNSLNTFQLVPPKDISCEVWPKLDKEEMSIVDRRWTDNDGRRSTGLLKQLTEHYVLR